MRSRTPMVWQSRSNQEHQTMVSRMCNDKKNRLFEKKGCVNMTRTFVFLVVFLHTVIASAFWCGTNEVIDICFQTEREVRELLPEDISFFWYQPISACTTAKLHGVYKIACAPTYIGCRYLQSRFNGDSNYTDVNKCRPFTTQQAR